MTRIARHTFALTAAMLLTLLSFHQALTLPPAAAATTVVAPVLA